MTKTRQRELQKWLRSQQKNIKPLMWLNVALGVINALFIILQMWLLASILQQMIVVKAAVSAYFGEVVILFLCFLTRAIFTWARERVGFTAGQILRRHLRAQILQKLAQIGPISIGQKPAGSWAALMLEQVENLHNFYARYLPQQFLSLLVPLVILAAVFPYNWAAGLILFATMPLLPLFMALAGMKAAEANQKYIGVLSRLSGQFLDRLRGLETIRLFNQGEAQSEQIRQRTEEFRLSTMEVLKMAFLSSAVLEFFTAVSIAVMAVYFGFYYLGELDFGDYHTGVTLFIGFFCLMLAPEFYQPMRELGVYYHDKAAAVGAADSIEQFLNETVMSNQNGQKNLPNQPLVIQASNCVVLSPQGQALTAPLNFRLNAGQRIALIGQSGAGKTSLMNALLGFLPYQGSLTINGVELRELNLARWRAMLAWVGQNPQLIYGTLRENILLGNPNTDQQAVESALKNALADEFVQRLGLDYLVSDSNRGISGGQAQRIAITRALLRPYQLLLLDEPTASLDIQSEQQVLQALQQLSHGKTTLMITHRIEDLQQCDQIWLMKNGDFAYQGDFAGLQKLDAFKDLLQN